MTPGGWVYFDHSQTQNEDSVTIGGYTTIEKVYSYEPVPDSLTKEQGKYVMGAQGNVWTEYMGNEKKVEYMIFPRMAALSEVLWSQKKDSLGFAKKLMTQFKRYDLWKANYSKAYYDLKMTIMPDKNNNAVIWKLVKKGNKGVLKVGEVDKGFSFIDKDSFEVKITKEVKYEASLVEIIKEMNSETMVRKTIYNNLSSPVIQSFHFNKATGKKITLTNLPSERYPGDGAFTLANGVQNEKGRARSNEFLGFSGTDCEAILDLGKTEKISNVKVHIFHQPSDQIWRPQYVEIFSSIDGKNFTSIGMTDDLNTAIGNGIMEKDFDNVSTRYIKVVVKNWGEIPANNPGVGNKAWLLVDEIEVN